MRPLDGFRRQIAMVNASMTNRLVMHLFIDHPTIRREYKSITTARYSHPSDVQMRNIAKRWTMPIRDWKSALNQFGILFDERLQPAYTFIYKHL